MLEERPIFTTSPQKLEEDRNGRGVESKYASWGQWRKEKAPVFWKPQCDEKLSWEAQRGKYRQREGEGERE